VGVITGIIYRPDGSDCDAILKVESDSLSKVG